ISSSVSVPAKPERRPSLPPSKQANKNLILKAISEAQESVTKTTNYSTVPQKQTLPVAPRTRTSQEELLAEVVQGQSRTPRISSPIKEEETKGDSVEKNQGDLSFLSGCFQDLLFVFDVLQFHYDVSRRGFPFIFPVWYNVWKHPIYLK
ncbi:ZC3H14 isoform 18, partial [Pongo abelii]